MQKTGCRGQGTEYRRGGRWLALGFLATILGGGAFPVRGQAAPAKTPPVSPPVPDRKKPPVVPPSPTAGQKTPTELVFPVALSCRPWNGLYVTDIVINNGAQRVLLDTGLNVNAISPDAALTLDVTSGTTKVRVEVFDNTGSVLEGALKSLRLGNLTVTDLRVALADILAMMSGSENASADSPAIWLGAPFLANYQVTFNFREKYIVLDLPTAKPTVEKTAIKVPITLKDGRVYVNVGVGKGKPFPALLDTGTVGTLLPGVVMTSLKLKPTREIALTRNGKQGAAILTTLPKLSVGKAEVKALQVVYLASGEAPEFNRSLAVLGTDFLRRYKVTINYAQKFLLLTPPAPPAPVDPNAAPN